MLNKQGQRELAYVVRVDKVTEIPGYDRVELAHVGGWTIVIGKNQVHAGDLAIYFEIDSRLPQEKPFTDMEFLVKKKFKVKTQKMCNSISQGLLMTAEDFGWEYFIENNGLDGIIDSNGIAHYYDDESRFLTKQLNVTYYVAEDNKRKANYLDKYKKMAQRNKKLFSKQPYKWLMDRTWGKKLLFIFYGNKNDNGVVWPYWVKKTDEERIENMTWILSDKQPWIATEKIDGTSTTFTMRRKPFGRYDFYVCSRNVVFDKPDRQCFYHSNVYLEMAEKYNIKDVLRSFIDEFDCEWVTIQGETYGAGIQVNDYDLDYHDFMAFNLITSDDGRWNSRDMKNILENIYDIPCVPILNASYILPDTVEELREYVHSQPSEVNNKMKEGIVFRSYDGTKSFKCVDPEYLMKFH